MKSFIIIVTILIAATACKNKTEPSQHEIAETTLAVDYRKLGDSLSTQAQQALLANVSDAMAKGGPAYAVDFCHENAVFITDVFSKEAKVSIQRISLKNRNPENRPAVETDTEMLHYYAVQKEAGKPLRDTVITGKQQTLYYKPIVLGMPACLKCHGMPDKDIDAKTLALLQKKYPEDKATGYKSGDMRGAWKISFPK